MTSDAATPEEYIAELPEDRQEAIQAIRKAINDNLPDGYEEGMQYGMIGWYVPHSIYPPGYHCDPKQPLPFVSLASQKNHIGLYMMCIYSDPEMKEWFVNEWKATGNRLDMGKSCVRIKKLEQAPLDVIGESVAKVPVDDLIKFYEEVVKPAGKR